MTTRFSRCSLGDLQLVSVRAHGGEGEIRFKRIVEAGDIEGACHFIDFAEIPPGASIGRHTHARHEEEFYLILSGEGIMWRDGESFGVSAGDLIRNAPGGSHGLENRGEVPVRVFVFELETRARP